MTPMSVAVVVDRFDSRGGGAERSTVQTVEHLAARGHQVAVIAGYAPDQDLPAGAQILRYAASKPRLPTRWLRFIAWARRQLEQRRFDTSLSVTTTGPARVIQPRGGTVRETLERNIALRSQPVSRALKRCLIALSPKQQMMLRVERRTLTDPSVRRIVAISRYVADQLQRHYHVDPSRIELIPNAADMPTLSSEERRALREQSRRRLGIPQDQLVFLFAALNPRLKGADQLLQATHRLTQRGLRPLALFVGHAGGAQRRLVNRLGLGPLIRFLGPTDQMAPLYVAADVTVHPTFYDPASKVVIESLMMGTPAITTSYNGASDLVLDPGGKALRGRVIPDPADVDALTQAMAEMADPTQRQRCVQALAGMRESLSMSQHVDQLERVLAAAR